MKDGSMQAQPLLIRRHKKASILPVFVLLLALAVQGTEAQLWDKVPFINRFTKAAQAAKAAAASLTAPHAASPSTKLPPAAPVLPPAPALGTPAAVTGLKAPPVAAPNATQQAPAGQPQKGKNAGKKKGSAVPKLKTTGKKDTQAGCSCLAEWDAKPGGVKLSGCANPDNDPLGSWCPVDPNECLGYYSTYRTEKGKLRFYDYCAPVRERTKKGCLCESDWNLGDGAVGKSHYRDGCARPHASQGKRVCKVDEATCPPGVEVNDIDECADSTEPMMLSQAKTWHNCDCSKGWSYRYEDGTTAIFSTCANPDSDPLGPWCEVDPNVCRHSAAIIKNGDQKMSIDYCQSKFKPPEATDCTAQLKLYDQCGGKTNCTHTSCLNAPWPGACCPHGSECRRQDAYYYQCLPLNADITTKTYTPAPTPPPAAPASPIVAQSNTTVAATVPADVVSSSPQQPPSSNSNESKPADAATSEVQPTHEPAAEGNLEDVIAAEEAKAVGQEAGQRVWVKLRLGMDYDLLVSQPQRLGQFKSDVVAWLREVAGGQHICDAGVDELLPGSVIALSYLDFEKDAPAAVVDAALENLQNNGQVQYAESKLPAKWGWLLNYSTGQNKTELMQEQYPADVQISTVTFPSGKVKQAPRQPAVQLSRTAKTAIIIACTSMLLTVVCVVFVVKRRRAAKRRAETQAAAAALAARRKAVVSGYLNDIDGMDDAASESCKATTIKSSQQAASTLHKVGQGLRGALSTNRNTLLLNSGSTLNSSRKAPSEAGSNRLWNWLQKAETPSSMETRQDPEHPTEIIRAEPAKASNTDATVNLQPPRPVLPSSPRPVQSHPLPALDLSDPGGAFRVPPPSPRFTDRATGPGTSPAEAAAAAVAAATAAATAGNGSGHRTGSLLSPRPAPAQAALLSTHDAMKYNHARSTEDRRAVGSMSLMANHNPHSMHNMPPGLEALQSNSTLYASAAELPSFNSDEPGLGNSTRNAINAVLNSAGDELAATGRLPPGMGMGPFLRAAIKSLTGQSVEGSEGSETGIPERGEGSAGSSGATYKPDNSNVRGPSNLGNPVGQSLHSQVLGYHGHAAGQTKSQPTHAAGMGSNPAAARLAAEEAAELNTVSSSDPDLQGSVFQSLWMHRLLAAAQAQQAEEAMGYGQHRQ